MNRVEPALHPRGVEPAAQQALHPLEHVRARHDALHEQDELGTDAELDVAALPAQQLSLLTDGGKVLERVTLGRVADARLDPHVQPALDRLRRGRREALHPVAEHRHRVGVQVVGDRPQVGPHARGVPARVRGLPVLDLVADAAVRQPKLRVVRQHVRQCPAGQ